MALASAATAPPSSPVLFIYHGCWLWRLGQLYGFLVVGLGAVTNHTLCGCGPVLVSANCACPVLRMGVESVSVIVLLTGIHRRVERRTTARVGAGSLGGLGGTAGPRALTQALCAAECSGPVQIGAHLAGPLTGNLSHAGRLDSWPSAGVGADEEVAATLSSGRVPPQTGVQIRAVLVRFLCDNGTAQPLCTAHSALDCRWPVLIGAVVTGPLYLRFRHRGSLWMVKLRR